METNKNITNSNKLAVVVLGTAMVAAVVLFLVMAVKIVGQFSSSPQTPFGGEKGKIVKFTSSEEFKKYLEEGEDEGRFYYSRAMTATSPLVEGDFDVALGSPQAEIKAGSAAPERVSQTNVQVVGIDEPDIVKTDGKEIYFSKERRYEAITWDVVESEERSLPRQPFMEEAKIKNIQAFPPGEMAVDGEIDQYGEMLLYKNILIIFASDKIYGYDVSNPKSPQKKWEIEYLENSSLQTARLLEDRVYLVLRENIKESNPCPIAPLKIHGQELTVPCTDIYHPTIVVPADVTFTAISIDPVKGEVENFVSFIGSSGQSVVYMSSQAIYVTYTYPVDMFEFMLDFFTTEMKDVLPQTMMEKMKKLAEYDLSSAAKMTEFEQIMEKYEEEMDEDDSLKFSNEMGNRMDDYAAKRIRDMERTGIVKISLDNLDVAQNGIVPGYPLNNFALDEYKDNLRIAVTIGGNFGWGMGDSVNDVYVLNEQLEVMGSVKDLGKTERIYSVRFIGDKGYVVTFRQTDPFYVLDLASPQNPLLKGELKIPGFSSYLHPISEERILGVGQEGSQVKLSLFDVGDPENPFEAAKYLLDEHWTEVSNNYHAFLMDAEHEIFFIPASKGGYVFSYSGDKLEMKKAVSDISAKRAIYINDYLYIIGNDKITVLNETDWEKVRELEL